MAREITNRNAPTATENHTGLFRRRVLTAVFITVAVVALLLLLYGTAEVLLLLFISLLLAVALRTLSHWLHSNTALSEKLALAIVCIGILLVLVILGLLLGPSLAQQFDQFVQQLPQSLNSLEDQINQYQWGRELLSPVPLQIRQAA